MPTRINEIRMSFIRFERFDQLIPDETPLAWLSNLKKYRREFQLANNQSHEGFWVLPWDTSKPYWERRAKFWIHYLGSNLLDNIEPVDAWIHLIPFRVRKFGYGLGDISGEHNLKLTIEGFAYPHGIAVVANYYLRDMDASLPSMVELSLNAKDLALFNVKWATAPPGKNESRGIPLETIFREALKRLRSFSVGQKHDIVSYLRDEASVFTIIEGRKEEDSDFQPGGTLHKALDAVCSWSGKIDEIVPADYKMITGSELKHPRVEEYLYMNKGGKTIWSPQRFQPKSSVLANKKRIASLNCYHRNVVFVTLQTESLINMLHLIEEQPIPLRLSLRDLGRSTATILHQLHGGDNRTYKSFIPWQQIEAEKELINQVLNEKLQSLELP